MDIPESPQTITQEAAEEFLLKLAGSHHPKFPSFFRFLRDLYPREVRRMSMKYLATCESEDDFAPLLVSWVKMTVYFPLLLEADLLSLSGARRVAGFLCAEDPDFFLNVSRLSGNIHNDEDTAILGRALSILDGLSDYRILFPWLRGLTGHDDERIRSQAAKALCRLKANAVIVNRQMSSPDPRVRANAIEALWHVSNPEIEAVLRNALRDRHHRVVVNALIGLHYAGVTDAASQLAEYVGHSDEKFRLAAVWALGYLGLSEYIPLLQSSTGNDSSELVRDRADDSLQKLLSAQVVPRLAA